MGAERERVALVSFVVSALLAGGNGVGVRFSNRELAPLWGAGVRFFLAVAVLLAVMAALKLKFPRGRALVGAIVYGALYFGAAFGFGYYGMVRVQAGLGQTLLALVPLVTLLLAVLQRQERLRGDAVVGALLAVAGMAVMCHAPLQEGVPLASMLALLAGAVCVAQATVLVRHFPPVHAVTMNAVGMTTGGALLLIGSALLGESTVVPQRTTTWLALGYLVVIGSVLVFVLFIVVLRVWSAPRAAYAFVIIPIVTVALSAWLDDEPLRAGLVLGGLLVLAGVYVGALRPALVPTAPTAPTAAL